MSRRQVNVVCGYGCRMAGHWLVRGYLPAGLAVSTEWAYYHLLLFTDGWRTIYPSVRENTFFWVFETAFLKSGQPSVIKISFTNSLSLSEQFQFATFRVLPVIALVNLT